MIEIYTDGSAYPNDGTGNGGYAFIVVENDDLLHKYSRKESPSTNNRMELQSIIDSILFIQNELPNDTVTIYSDSKYCVNGYTSWMKNWQRRGWYTSSGQEVKNKDLWQELYELRGYDLKWVKAHNGNKWNEVVDGLASYKNNNN